MKLGNRAFITCAVFFGISACLSAAQITLGQNAIVNGDAEAGAGSPSGDIVAVPGWTATGQFTAVQYGAPGGFPLATDPGPADRGSNFFAGGPSAALSTGTQSVDVSNIAVLINSGTVAYTLSGYLGGFQQQDDNAVLTVNFMSGAALIGSASIGPVTEPARDGLTGLLFRSTTGFIPTGTTSIDFSLTLTRLQGSYDDGYADNLSFVATGGAPAVPEPAVIGLFGLGLAGMAVAVRRSRR